MSEIAETGGSLETDAAAAEVAEAGGSTEAVDAASAAFSLSVTVSYAPSPQTSALAVTETGQVFGPYPGSVSPNGDGTYSLSVGLASLPQGLAAGPVSVQPGDILGGAFVPAAGIAPIAGLLQSTTAEAPPLDLDFACGPSLTSIAENGTHLVAGSDGFLHLLLCATDSSLGAAVDLTAFPVQMAAVPTSPLAADWLPATWLPRTAAPAGSYATLAAGPDNELVLASGQYWLYARVTVGPEVYEMKSSAPFLVRP